MPQPIRITELSPGPYKVTLTLVDHDRFPIADMLSAHLLQQSLVGRLGRRRDVAAAAEVEFFVVSEDGKGAPPLSGESEVSLPLRVPDGTITAIRTRKIGEKTWTDVEEGDVVDNSGSGGGGGGGGSKGGTGGGTEGVTGGSRKATPPKKMIRCKLNEKKLGRKMIVATSEEPVSEVKGKVAKAYGVEDETKVKLFDGEGYEIEVETSMTIGILAEILGSDGNVLYLDVEA